MNRFMITTLTLAAMSLGSAALAQQKPCPPGLAKKSVACVPPGQARKVIGFYNTGDWIGDQDYHRITYPDRYSLPPLPVGQRYVILNGQIMIMTENNAKILTVIRAVQAILD